MKKCPDAPESIYAKCLGVGIEFLAILNVQRININWRSNGPALESKNGQTQA